MLAHCGNIDTMSTMSTLATMLFPDTQDKLQHFGISQQCLHFLSIKAKNS